MSNPKANPPADNPEEPTTPPADTGAAADNPEHRGDVTNEHDDDSDHVGPKGNTAHTGRSTRSKKHLPTSAADAGEDASARPQLSLHELLTRTQSTPFHTADLTLVPLQRGKVIYVPRLCDLGGATIQDAFKAACTVIDTLGLNPGSAILLDEDLVMITDWCASQSITRLADVVDDTAHQLIVELANLSGLTFRPTLSGPDMTAARIQVRCDLARAHRMRNMLIALRSAALVLRARKDRHRLATDTITAGLPDLPPLEDRKSRPVTDDEILLARLSMEFEILEGGNPRPLLAYLVAESGGRSAESVRLTTDDLPNRTDPTQITSPRVWSENTRTIVFTTYARDTLPVLLHQLREGDQPLTYTGAQPTTPAACAALDGVLSRLLRRAGVTDVDVTPKSLSLWRVQHHLVNDTDITEARRIHGGQTANVLADLKLDHDETGLAEGVVYLRRRDTREVVATLNSQTFYDASLTRKKRRSTPPRRY